MSPVPGFPTRSPLKEAPISRAFMRPGSLSRTPLKRDAPFPGPSFHYLSQFPVYRPPLQVPQQDPYGERHTCLQNLLHPIPWKFNFPSESLVKEPPPCSPRGYLWRKILRLLSHWSIYSFMSARVPQKGASYKMAKNIRSPSTEPHTDRRPTYNGVRPGTPRGSLMTLLSLPQCHAALGTIPSTLAWVGQSSVSQHVS